MKRIVSLLICMAAIGAASAQPQEDALQHRMFLGDPETVLELKQRMNRMAGEWVDLEILTNAETPDSRAIRAALKALKGTAKSIQRINRNPQLEAQLKNLIAQIDTMHANLRKKSPEILERDLNALSGTCFGCHAAHAPMED